MTMQVLRSQDHSPLAFISEEVQFTEKGARLADILQKDGIRIPVKLQGNFDGRSVIYYDPNNPDPLFSKALLIYFENALKESGYTLTVVR